MSDRPESRRSSATVVAVVGIAATAVVGIAGSTITWVVAGQDRDTQIALARDARIYEKRTTAYVDALMEMQSLSDDMRLLRFESVPTWPDFQRSQANLRARMTLYASNGALPLYNTMFFSASRALSAIEGLRESGDYLDRRARAELWRGNTDIRAFETARRTLQFVVASEAGDARRNSAAPRDDGSARSDGDTRLVKPPVTPGAAPASALATAAVHRRHADRPDS